MNTKLIQKNLLKGTQEFEIVGEQVNVRTISSFKKTPGETLSVMLAVLNPEPVITRTHLQFLSRVNGEALLSLALSKPNVTEFNRFVNELKQKAQDEYDAISGISVKPKPEQYGPEQYELEPPEFNEVSHEEIIKGKKVNVEGVENAIQMLETYVSGDEVQPLITALTALKDAPQDHRRLVEVASAFNALGPSQGAVLTYAPYVSIMLSDDPFG